MPFWHNLSGLRDTVRNETSHDGMQRQLALWRGRGGQDRVRMWRQSVVFSTTYPEATKTDSAWVFWMVWQMSQYTHFPTVGVEDSEDRQWMTDSHRAVGTWQRFLSMGGRLAEWGKERALVHSSQLLRLREVLPLSAVAFWWSKGFAFCNRSSHGSGCSRKGELYTPEI